MGTTLSTDRVQASMGASLLSSLTGFPAPTVTASVREENARSTARNAKRNIDPFQGGELLMENCCDHSNLLYVRSVNCIYCTVNAISAIYIGPSSAQNAAGPKAGRQAGRQADRQTETEQRPTAMAGDGRNRLRAPALGSESLHTRCTYVL